MSDSRIAYSIKRDDISTGTVWGTIWTCGCPCLLTKLVIYRAEERDGNLNKSADKIFETDSHCDPEPETWREMVAEFLEALHDWDGAIVEEDADWIQQWADRDEKGKDHDANTNKSK